jgi:hypothetical protein
MSVARIPYPVSDTAICQSPPRKCDSIYIRAPAGEYRDALINRFPRTLLHANGIDIDETDRPASNRERSADVFNVFNQREPIDYDNYTQVTFPVRNPDFGRVIEYQDPIQARVGLRFEF